MKRKLKQYKVWIAQVNQSVVDVDAGGAMDAIDKARALWRKDIAEAIVLDVQQSEGDHERM